MRTAIICLWLALLVACGRQQSFDERYSNTARRIGAEAHEMDNEINQEAGADNANSVDKADSITRSRDGP